MKGGKICLHLKSDDDPACKGHKLGPVQVEDRTMYVRVAKGPMLTSVYDLYTMSATQLSQDLLDFLVNASVEDLAGIGPYVPLHLFKNTDVLIWGILKMLKMLIRQGLVPTLDVDPVDPRPMGP